MRRLRRPRRFDPTIHVPTPTGCGPRTRRCGRARSNGRQSRKPQPTESGPAPRRLTATVSGVAQCADRVVRKGPLSSSCGLVHLRGSTWTRTYLRVSLRYPVGLQELRDEFCGPSSRSGLDLRVVDRLCHQRLELSTLLAVVAAGVGAV